MSLNFQSKYKNIFRQIFRQDFPVFSNIEVRPQKPKHTLKNEAYQDYIFTAEGTFFDS